MINRWNGWLHRPYSVLEHSVVGAGAMLAHNHGARAVLSFLLHDFEESEFGDWPAPAKALHTTDDYRADVAEFNLYLARSVGLEPHDFESPAVKQVDHAMAWAESHSVALLGDPAHFKITYPANSLPGLCLQLIIEKNTDLKATFWEIFNACRTNLA